MGKRTAQIDTIKDITNDSQVNSYFSYRWSPHSLTFNIYFYLFIYNKNQSHGIFFSLICYALLFVTAFMSSDSHSREGKSPSNSRINTVAFHGLSVIHRCLISLLFLANYLQKLEFFISRWEWSWVDKFIQNYRLGMNFIFFFEVYLSVNYIGSHAKLLNLF